MPLPAAVAEAAASEVPATPLAGGSASATAEDDCAASAACPTAVPAAPGAARSEKSSFSSAAGVAPFFARCFDPLPPAFSWARNSIGETLRFCLSIARESRNDEKCHQRVGH